MSEKPISPLRQRMIEEDDDPHDCIEDPARLPTTFEM